VYRKLELGSGNTSENGNGKGFLSSHSKFVKDSIPEVSNALAHHPSIDEKERAVRAGCPH
jgi:hypothetical protein